MCQIRLYGYDFFSAIKPPTYEKPVRLWWDDSLPGFVRRLEWSPEGQLLACPGAELNPPPVPGKADAKIDDDVIKIDDDSKENVRPSTPTNEPNRQVRFFLPQTSFILDSRKKAQSR